MVISETPRLVPTLPNTLANTHPYTQIAADSFKIVHVYVVVFVCMNTTTYMWKILESVGTEWNRNCSCSFQTEIQSSTKDSKVIQTELKNATCLNSDRGTLSNVLIVYIISHQEAERDQVDDKCVVSSSNESLCVEGQA
jgi:hypothetical protein